MKRELADNLTKDLREDILSYNDIVTDLKDIWNDLNGFLDEQDARERDVLIGMLDVVRGLHHSIRESANKIDKIKESL